MIKGKANKRLKGLLLPLSSIPTKYGIGDFGESSYRFVDICHKYGFKIWQILPLNPVGFASSPYQPLSSFAIDPAYIDISSFSTIEIDGISDSVDFDRIRETKVKACRDYYDSLKEKDKRHVLVFFKKNKDIRDYAEYVYLRDKNHGKKWNEWEDDSLDEAEVRFQMFLQYLCLTQWKRLKAYANRKGIKIFGDIPFYPGYDSSDVYANRKNFLLDEKYNPTFIAGVPPDYFSETGQRWGNPIFDWEYLKKTSFSFLKRRIDASMGLYDILRIDHFRAFSSFYQIPSYREDAKVGEWKNPPGEEFLTLLNKSFRRYHLIAEDLGLLTKEVYELRDEFHLAGMNVIQFSFQDGEVDKKVDWNKENLVAYLGTHDNNTIKGFFTSLDKQTQDKYIKALDEADIKEDNRISKRFLDYLFSRKCRYRIALVSDILDMGEEGRINIPGVVDSRNWTFKLNDLSSLEDRLKEYIVDWREI